LKGDDDMPTLKEQAVSIVQSVPDDKMSHVIEVLKLMTGILDSQKTTDDNSAKLPRSTARGILKDKLWMSDDFNEPLEEMREDM
jgi:predicted short-subunit dehydrogenase-like oxidoreductase (DUF2520 family)